MMQTIPLQDAASQTLRILLDGQLARIDLRQFSQALYCDLYVNDVLIIGGVICQNLNRIVRGKYLGFAGDLMFVDTEGSSDPLYPGLGSRYELVFLSASELP